MKPLSECEKGYRRWMNPKIPYGSESYRKLNPHIFAEPVARLRTDQPQSDKRREGQDPPLEAGKDSIRYCITLTVYRKRLLDTGDNDRGALKALRDQIAEYLGFTNDDDQRLTWGYHQIKSRDTQGTHVLITMI